MPTNPFDEDGNPQGILNLGKGYGRAMSKYSGLGKEGMGGSTNNMAANAISAMAPQRRLYPDDAIATAGDMANQDAYRPQETGLQKAGRIFGTIMKFI